MRNPSLRHFLLSTALGLALALPLATGSVQAQTPAPAAATEAAQSQLQSQAQTNLPEITKSEDISSFTLENGLKVVIIPDHRAPVVTQMIWYHVGSADEAPGKSCIAHFLEHLMFKGTKTYPAGEFSAKIAAIGGQENAFTSYDYTAYFQRVAPDALEMAVSYTHLTLPTKRIV